MTVPKPCRVRLDGTAFLQHRRSGISRYMAELVRAFDDDPALGIQTVTPYRWVASVHASSASKRFTSLPLPRRLRQPVLNRLNRDRRSNTGADVAHLPLYEPAAMADVAEARLATTVYDFTWERFPELFGDLTKELEHKRTFLEAADVLLCISEATRADLRHFHPELDVPVVVTPLAAGVEFSIRGRGPVRGMPDEYLLHVGNRAEHKNVDLLFAAFAMIRRRHPHLWLVLSGAGLPDEEDRLARSGIRDRTKIVRVSDHDLPALYQHAVAFIFPSRYEGFGLPIVEALAAGCPVVVADTPACVEVAGDAALVVDANDVEALAEDIDRIVTDRGLARSLSEAGVRRVADFSWHRTAELTADAYIAAAAPHS